MGQFYVHPNNVELNIFDSQNYEHALVDQESFDHIKIMSPFVLYWSLDHNETRKLNDEISNLYQESDLLKFYSSDPVRVYMYTEHSPVISELNRLGLTTMRETNFLANKTDMHMRLGRAPLGGDLFRVSYTNTEGKMHQQFYTVVSANEADLHLYRYLHYVVNSEQTNLSNIPKEILEYRWKEE